MNREPRNAAKVQEPKERIKNFDEVSLGFDEETMLLEADRCLNCKNAPCMKGCPVGVRIPEFISCLKNKDYDKAVETIKATNSLPAICGRVCPQEKQCESLCVRKAKLGGSVAIGTLERYVGDYSLAKGAKKSDVAKNGYKVAVVGSGPAGLSCAGALAKEGFEVTVFEAFHRAGGVLVYGIPEFRLPKDLVVEKEIEELKALGVEIRLNTVIGKTITIDELKEEYDAIFLGTGAGLPIFMGIKGEGLNGVYAANEFLTRVNLMKAYKQDSVTPVYCGKRVAVIGAGNVAMDACRTAMRLGAEHVYIIYRRGREEMPARAEEIEHAIEEGVELKLLTNPVEILGKDKVEGIRCIKMELGEPDQSGRRRPQEVKGSEFDIEVDEVIVSLGTSPNPLLKKSCEELETSLKGTIVVNEETMETSLDSVYAGGDAVTGAATVILAMGAGKKAAKAISDRLLRK